jgi:23S rRNA (adenine2503-C2)-methyltransferase
MPSISTIAPNGTETFFERLLEIKRSQYSGGHFQFQFSIHTTDEQVRDQIIPVKKWDFSKMAEYGHRFYQPGDRKVTLNFALAKEMPVDPEILLKHFTPDKFLIKITPLNPTYKATEENLSTYIDPNNQGKKYQLVRDLEKAGYRVIVSIGEVEENYIGSNCGQYVRRHLEAAERIEDGYTYRLQEIEQA